MAERYKQITKNENQSYIEDSPISLEAYAILRDLKERRTLAQLKLCNCSARTVTGVVVNVQAIDQIGNKIEDVAAYHYTNINAAPGESFGTKSPIYFSGDIAAKFLEVSVLNVLFRDGTIWNGDKRFIFRKIAPSETLEELFSDYDLVTEYRRITNSTGNDVPRILGNNSWKCICGAINSQRDTCLRCKASKELAFGYLDKEKLRESFKEQQYIKARKALSNENIESLKSAIDVLDALGNYKDAPDLAQKCVEKISLIKKQELEMAEQVQKRKEELELRERTVANKKKKIRIASACIIVSCIVLVILFTKVIIPKQKYNEAVKKYGREFADTYFSLKVGDTFKFGSYEQDNNIENGKEEIKWLVLKKKGNRALVISRYALDSKQYNDSEESVTWETCTLREWLNEDFLRDAFSDEEQAMIPRVLVSPDANPHNNTNPGKSTKDQVFLLSIAEAEKYFESDRVRQCQIANDNHDNCWWWLRSPGDFYNRAALVNSDGSIDYDGTNVNYVAVGSGGYVDYGAVRPALWLDIGF